MKIHHKEITLSLELGILRNPNPYESQIIESFYGVMETCAPYLGQMCVEYLDGEWVWQPYSRVSKYFGSLEEAYAHYEEHYEDPYVSGTWWLEDLIKEEKAA